MVHPQALYSAFPGFNEATRSAKFPETLMRTTYSYIACVAPPCFIFKQIIGGDRILYRFLAENEASLVSMYKVRDFMYATSIEIMVVDYAQVSTWTPLRHSAIPLSIIPRKTGIYCLRYISCPRQPALRLTLRSI